MPPRKHARRQPARKVSTRRKSPGRKTGPRRRQADKSSLHKLYEFAMTRLVGLSGWVKIVVAAVLFFVAIFAALWTVSGYGDDIQANTERQAQLRIRQSVLEEEQDVQSERFDRRLDHLAGLVQERLTGLNKQADSIQKQLNSFLKYLEHRGERPPRSRG